MLVYLFFFFFNDTATTEIYTRPYTLSLHDALPISPRSPSPRRGRRSPPPPCGNSPGPTPRPEEHTPELQSHGLISYAVFCLKKKKNQEAIKGVDKRLQTNKTENVQELN